MAQDKLHDQRDEHERLSDELESRQNNLKKLIDAGIDPWGGRFPVSDKSECLHAGFDSATKEALEDQEVKVEIAGRLVALRRHGKAAFADLLDGFGTIQLFFRFNDLSDPAVTPLNPDKKSTGDASQWDLLDSINLGDWIGVSGILMKTKTGELSIKVKEWRILAKALRPLPEKYHGLKDKELRYRYRYLDLIANPEIRSVFRARAEVIRTIRSLLDERDYLEVETPALHKIAGGAAARPFVTHHNTLDIDMFLRISLELYLKRLMIGGIDRVYEIGRIFRNEGMDRDHNPEFTMLEAYEAFGNLDTMMELTETICRTACKNVTDGMIASFRDHEIDFGPKFPRKDYADLILEYSGVDIRETRDRDSLLKACRERDLDVDDGASSGKLIDVLYSELVEPNLIQPTFVLNYPIEMSPLAKLHPDRPGFVQRFELFIAGHEIANAFTELNDPIDQRERFTAQSKMRAEGDEEAHPVDDDFLYAIEHGMPPAGGGGLGVDRLVMIVTGAHSIRDVILFPMLR